LVLRQCNLLDLNHSTIYYRERAENVEDVELMRLIDAQYTETPFYGYRRMMVYLQNSGYKIDHKRVVKLMRKLGLAAIYPKPNLLKPNKEHLNFPYLLKGMKIEFSNKVWATDITYIRLKGGFICLLAIMDRHSRFVIEFEVSNTNEPPFSLR
jgi:putative transposase